MFVQSWRMMKNMQYYTEKLTTVSALKKTWRIEWRPIREFEYHTYKSNLMLPWGLILPVLSATSYLIFNIAYFLNTLPEKNDVVFHQSFTFFIYRCRYNSQQCQVPCNKMISQRCCASRRRRGRERSRGGGIKEGPCFWFRLNSQIRGGDREVVRLLGRGKWVYPICVDLFLRVIGRGQSGCKRRRIWRKRRRITEWLRVFRLTRRRRGS